MFFGAGGGWQGVAGTSAGTPQWAALFALANQGRVGNPNSPIFIKTTLAHAAQDIYGLPASDFFDITSGSNGAFSAGAGYDFVTGRGSPRADLIVPALFSDNYIALMPGEKRTISISLLDSDTRGEKPAIRLEGYNLAQH